MRHNKTNIREHSRVRLMIQLKKFKVTSNQCFSAFLN